MDVWFLVLLVVVLLFGFVVIFGAPYVPTLKPQIEIALDMLDLKPGQTLVEVGSGDGRVLLAAAKRGLCVVGYELNPILVLVSLWRTRSMRGRVKVVWGDALTKSWPPADGLYIFGVAGIMPKVYKKIVQSNEKPVKVASFSFEIPGQRPVAVKKGVYLYTVRPNKK